ncbi:F0F1 ATP synthase subunit B [Buchnera aphidicola]|uniref:ATP synthase subunit b n=1 Tax=Buchnera aphidicola subsp. Melaphis rhois TaxID=118103 RepID=A0A4D6Y2H0_BUCMH|nr:F0F1 ATP synthase subunit B [Buchnera aphidicola]QCI23059.1 F0F1 ATP synthase subunit B [Buchnera aphidicola (Melaphis rhois)]
MNFNATIFGQAISFCLFVYFCMKYIWPPIIYAINTRQKEISDSLLNIENSKRKLDFYRKEVNDEINMIKDKAREIINQAKQKQIIILQQANIQAQEERKKILDKTQVEIRIQYQKLQSQLTKEVSQIAINIAKKILNDEVCGKTRKNIVNSLIQKL